MCLFRMMTPVLSIIYTARTGLARWEDAIQIPRVLTHIGTVIPVARRKRSTPLSHCTRLITRTYDPGRYPSRPLRLPLPPLVNLIFEIPIFLHVLQQRLESLRVGCPIPERRCWWSHGVSYGRGCGGFPEPSAVRCAWNLSVGGPHDDVLPS